MPPFPESKAPENLESYTSMAVGDVEAIGAHCQMPYCHQLDFLPFRCESCKGTFCLDHRTETAHSCSKAGAWARARREAQSASSTTPSSQKPSLLTHDQQCAALQCKTLINTALTPGVQCADCNRSYCLKHRMREDHDCANLPPIGARARSSGAAQPTSKEKGLAALERFKRWGAAKKAAAASSGSSGSSGGNSFLKKRSSAATAAAELNALKAAAKGDAKIPVEKRLYLHVEASADTTKAKFPTGKFFYSRDWSVGRVLDAAASALQVENMNNRGGGEENRLRVFHVEGGRLLEFGQKVGECVKDGNTIVLLRGVGPPVPDLIQP